MDGIVVSNHHNKYHVPYDLDGPNYRFTAATISKKISVLFVVCGYGYVPPTSDTAVNLAVLQLQLVVPPACKLIPAARSPLLLHCYCHPHHS